MRSVDKFPDMKLHYRFKKPTALTRFLIHLDCEDLSRPLSIPSLSLSCQCVFHRTDQPPKKYWLDRFEHLDSSNHAAY